MYNSESKRGKDRSCSHESGSEKDRDRASVVDDEQDILGRVELRQRVPAANNDL